MPRGRYLSVRGTGLTARTLQQFKEAIMEAWSDWPPTSGSIVNHIDGRSLQVASDKFGKSLANRFGAILDKYMRDRHWDPTQPHQLAYEVEHLLRAAAPHVFNLLSMELGYEPADLGSYEFFSRKEADDQEG